MREYCDFGDKKPNIKKLSPDLVDLPNKLGKVEFELDPYDIGKFFY